MVTVEYTFDYKGEKYGNAVKFKNEVMAEDVFKLMRYDFEESYGKLVCADEGHKWLPIPEDSELPKVCERCKCIEEK